MSTTTAQGQTGHIIETGKPEHERIVRVSRCFVGRPASLRSTSIFFAPTMPRAHARAGVAVYRDILADARTLPRRFDIASEDRSDHTLREFDMAQQEDYDATIFTHIRVELIARVPLTGVS